MPKYVIERDMAGAGKLSDEEVKGAARKSCAVLSEMGIGIQWLESFVTDDKLYCIYIAPDEKTVRDHAQKAGFPCNRVSAVRRVIDPTAVE